MSRLVKMEPGETKYVEYVELVQEAKMMCDKVMTYTLTKSLE